MTTLVLLPGLDGTGELFKPLIRELASAVSLQIISYPDDASLGYDDYVKLVRSKLPETEPYILLGESFSGPIAIRLAAEQPPLMTGLILCCTFASNPRPEIGWMARALRLIPFSHLPTFPMVSALLGPRPPADIRSILVGVLQNLRADVVRARLRVVLTVDVRQYLAQLKLPVLYLQAEKDVLVRPACGSEISDQCKHTELVRLHGPHGLLQAAPKEASAQILAFIRKVKVSL